VRHVAVSLVAILVAAAPGCGSRAPHHPDAGRDGSPSDGVTGGPSADAADAPQVLETEGGSDLAGAGDAASPADVPPADAPSSSTDARDAGGDAGAVEVGSVSRSPRCNRSYGWSWTAPLSATPPWIPTHGSPSVDTTANELLLPWDSKVSNPDTLSGAAVLEFDVSIEGNLTFFVQGVANDQQEPVPSLTRSGDELILASARYDGPAPAPGGFFTGQRFPAQRVHVTLFVDPSQHHIGMQVDTPTQSFFSGFSKVEIIPVEVTLVGDDLESERSTSSRIHVGPITGCDRGFNDKCVPDELGFCLPDGGPDAPPLTGP
jgi:hypothetical protein